MQTLYRNVIVALLASAVMCSPAFAAKKHKKKYRTPVPSAQSILLIEDDSNKVIFSRKADAVRSIASITKLLLAVTYVEQYGDTLHEVVEITKDDLDKIKGTRSGTPVGKSFTKLDMLGFALVKSDNRAAHALARTSNSTEEMVRKMNETAKRLGMVHTVVVEPTGLSPKNKSTANDLITLVRYASTIPLVAQLSTSAEVTSIDGLKSVRNTNPNVRTQDNYLVSKTGFINEAGGCVVSRITKDGKTYSMVVLKSRNTKTRWADVRYVTGLIKTNY